MTNFTRLKSFSRTENGSTITMFAMLLPILIGFAGLAFDIGNVYYTKSRLQGATDSAALSFVSHLTNDNFLSIVETKNQNFNNLIASSISFAEPNLPPEHNGQALQFGDFVIGEWNDDTKTFTAGAWDPTHTIFTSPSSSLLINAVQVSGELSETRNNRTSTFFAKLFNFRPSVYTKSFATVPIVPTIHVIAPNAYRAFDMSPTADVDSADIWVNSSDPEAAHIDSIGGFGSLLGVINGGASGAGAGLWKTHGTLITEKYEIRDLLAHQANPGYSSCDDNNLIIDQTSSITLHPGVYCGGIEIHNVDQLILTPGIYHIVDGPFRVEADSPTSTTMKEIVGEDVMLHFDGAQAELQIFGGSLYLGGRRSGEYEGYVIFSNRQTTVNATHIMHDVDIQVAGVIYAPVSNFQFVRADTIATCHSLCAVINTIDFDDAKVNWHPNISSLLSSKLDQSKNLPPPRALRPALRPVLRASPS